MNDLLKGMDSMKSFWGRGAVLCLLLAAFTAGPVLVGCNKRPDPRENPDFVDTSDPSKVQMKPIGGPGPDQAKE